MGQMRHPQKGPDGSHSTQEDYPKQDGGAMAAQDGPGSVPAGPAVLPPQGPRGPAAVVRPPEFPLGPQESPELHQGQGGPGSRPAGAVPLPVQPEPEPMPAPEALVPPAGEGGGGDRSFFPTEEEEGGALVEIFEPRETTSSSGADDDVSSLDRGRSAWKGRPERLAMASQRRVLEEEEVERGNDWGEVFRVRGERMRVL